MPASTLDSWAGRSSPQCPDSLVEEEEEYELIPDFQQPNLGVGGAGPDISQAPPWYTPGKPGVDANPMSIMNVFIHVLAEDIVEEWVVHGDVVVVFLGHPAPPQRYDFRSPGPKARVPLSPVAALHQEAECHALHDHDMALWRPQLRPMIPICGRIGPPDFEWKFTFTSQLLI
ncbi:uncharacterized protein LOC124171599 [Ischnura elegans]|uniref:uncharacterized protein LOC124171599 n=1 Tax=Ischnura elegans TaxID=197161 RepID=UPI001ED8BE57|nr:uncharacterized protein LOC124171599 [Ischnura elegans]